jgi:hypothetical protein
MADAQTIKWLLQLVEALIANHYKFMLEKLLAKQIP